MLQSTRNDPTDQKT